MRSDMNIGREKPAMENFVCDLRAAVHTVARKPGFTIVVALMLAVGIATNTAIFSVVYGVLLRPLPYGQDDRTVTVWQTAPKRSVDREETSSADCFDWQEQNQSFEEFGMAEPWGHLLTGDVEPEAIRSWVVSPGFFEALDAQPLRGRTFLPEEYQAGGIGGVVTHDPRYASHADRTIHLFDGRIAEIDNIGPGKERSS